jgi:hypothetical protein
MSELDRRWPPTPGVRKLAARLARSLEAQERIQAAAKRTGGYSRSVLHSDLVAMFERMERLSDLLFCAATGLALACEGGVSGEQLVKLWIDPHGLRAEIADALGHDALEPRDERT